MYSSLKYYLKVYKLFLYRFALNIYNVIVAHSLRKGMEKTLRIAVHETEYYHTGGPEIETFPFIDKFVVKKHHKEMCTHTWLSKKAYTSGTTGVPLQIVRDINSIAAEQHFLGQYYKWKGYYRVVFRGGQLFRVESGKRMFKKIPFINEIHVNNHAITEEGLNDLTQALSKIQKKICLYTGPSTATILAHHCLTHGISLNIHLVATSSEVLYPHQINLLKKAFNCPIRDLYGQAERVAALTLCSAGNYHPIADYSYIEFIPTNQGLYEIVGTTAHNFAMPLIRYRTGDIVELNKNPCPCGYEGASVKTIHGREGNIVTLNKRQLPATILSLPFRIILSIKECQVVITSSNKVIYKIVKLPSYTLSDEQKLEDEIKKIIPDVDFSIEYVDEIKKTRAGKFNFIVRESQNSQNPLAGQQS